MALVGRALSLATRGLLSGVAITIATHGLIQPQEAAAVITPPAKTKGIQYVNTGYTGVSDRIYYAIKRRYRTDFVLELSSSSVSYLVSQQNQQYHYISGNTLLLRSDIYAYQNYQNNYAVNPVIYLNSDVISRINRIQHELIDINLKLNTAVSDFYQTGKRLKVKSISSLRLNSETQSTFINIPPQTYKEDLYSTFFINAQSKTVRISPAYTQLQTHPVLGIQSELNSVYIEGQIKELLIGKQDKPDITFYRAQGKVNVILSGYAETQFIKGTLPRDDEEILLIAAVMMLWDDE